jgi:D-3-phosphoglycerate dehydrogenase
MPPLVIQTENLPQECSDWLAERVDLHICPPESLRFKELLPEAQGLVIRTYTTVDTNLIQAAKNLEVVGRAGVGTDNIDIQACIQNNIRVVYTPDANSEAVVEFVFSTMLPKLRPLHKIETTLDLDQWKLHRDASVCQGQFNETTLGIIGFGRVGSRLGIMAKSLGFRILFYDIKSIENDCGCNSVDLDTLLLESDVISVHVDGRPENSNLINAEILTKMKPDALFINTSRGFVVNSIDLTSFLAQHPDAFAILDVHNPEPFTPAYPLLGVENVNLYPHIAAKTETAMKNMGWVVKDVDLVLHKEEPVYEATAKYS